MKRLIALATLCALSAFAQGIPQGAGRQQLTNAQVGTSYTYVTGDFGKLVTHSNAAAIAGTLPQCSTAGFTVGWNFDVMNTGAGTLTITPTTSTIDGVATLVLTTGSGAHIVCDGTNYKTWHGGGGGAGCVNTAWVGMTLLNSWTQDGTADTVQASIDCTNRVWVRGGLVPPGGLTGGSILFNLPSLYRPTHQQSYLVPGGGTGNYWIVVITTGGDVTYYPPGGTNATTNFSLSGISYSLAP